MVDDVRRSMSIGQQAASASGDRHRDSRGLAAPTQGESGAWEDRRVHELDPVSSRTRLRTRSYQNRVPSARELQDQEVLSHSFEAMGLGDQHAQGRSSPRARGFPSSTPSRPPVAPPGVVRLSRSVGDFVHGQRHPSVGLDGQGQDQGIGVLGARRVVPTPSMPRGSKTADPHWGPERQPANLLLTGGRRSGSSSSTSSSSFNPSGRVEGHAPLERQVQNLSAQVEMLVRAQAGLRDVEPELSSRDRALLDAREEVERSSQRSDRGLEKLVQNLSARVEQLAVAQAGRGLTIPRLDRDPSSEQGQAERAQVRHDLVQEHSARSGKNLADTKYPVQEHAQSLDSQHHARVQAPDLKPKFSAQAEVKAWGWPAQDVGQEFREWQAQSTNGRELSSRPDGPTLSMLKCKLAKLKLAEVPSTWLKWAGNCRSVLRFLKQIVEYSLMMDVDVFYALLLASSPVVPLAVLLGFPFPVDEGGKLPW